MDAAEDAVPVEAIPEESGLVSYEELESKIYRLKIDLNELWEKFRAIELGIVTKAVRKSIYEEIRERESEIHWLIEDNILTEELAERAKTIKNDLLLLKSSVWMYMYYM